MNTFKQRDIVLVPFPFTDQSGTKVRPVLILSNDAYNRATVNALVCVLTTNLRNEPYSVTITPDDVEQVGSLRHTSRVKADTIALLDQSLVIKTIARLKELPFRQVIGEVVNLIEIG